MPRLPLRGMQTRSCRVHTTEAREVRFLLTDHSAFEVLGGQNAAQVLPEHTLCFFFCSALVSGLQTQAGSVSEALAWTPTEDLFISSGLGL